MKTVTQRMARTSTAIADPSGMTGTFLAHYWIESPGSYGSMLRKGSGSWSLGFLRRTEIWFRVVREQARTEVKGETMSGRSLTSRAVTVALLASLLAGLWAVADSYAGGPGWAGATYRGHSSGTLSKGTLILTVAASGTSVPTYSFRVDTLCGKDNLGGNTTYIWPINDQGSPPLKVSPDGVFSGSQHGSFTAPAITGVTKAPAAATYRFSVTGSFQQVGGALSGHFNLTIKTSTGYFCVNTNGPFSGTRNG